MLPLYTLNLSDLIHTQNFKSINRSMTLKFVFGAHTLYLISGSDIQMPI